MSISSKAFSLFQRDAFLFFTNLATGVIIARKLGPTVLGIWAILQLIPSYAEALGRLKFDVAAVYYLGKGKYRIGEMIFILNVLSIMSSLLIIGIYVWKFDYIYRFLFHNTGTDVRLLTYFIISLIPIQYLIMNYKYLHIYREDIHTYNMMIIIQALLSSLVNIVLLVSSDLGLPIVVFASIIASFAALLYGAVKLRQNEKMIPNLNMPMIKDLVSYGSKFYLAGIIGHLNGYITNLIMVLYLLPAQIAFFSMARGRGELILKIPNAISTIIFPRISKLSNNKESAQLATKAFRVSFLILFVVGILAIIFIKPLIWLLYGKNYLPMVLPFLVILPGLVISASSGLLAQYFAGTGRADLITKISIVPLIVQITMAFILIPAWGLLGASVVFLTAILVESLIRIIVFCYVSSCSLRNDLFLKRADFELVASFISSQLGKMRWSLSRYVFSK